ncbi:MAG: WYL domain-containing protein, partial [Saprospiraceae bacterium]
TESAFRRSVSPYLLKEYNKRWFLIGFDHAEQRVHTFPLDRILDWASDPLTHFYRHPLFVPDNWYRHVYGVSMPHDPLPEEILLEVTQHRKQYMLSKPLHPTQELVSETDGHALFRFHLIINFEWEQLILSYADDMRVCKPASLASRLQERLANALHQYVGVG